MIVRDFEADDAAQLIKLMRALAQFENYLDGFSVTEADVRKHGLGEDALFRAFVADEATLLIGMAITYIVPWTYTLRPRVVLKELFIAESGRGQGVGRALMGRVVDHARFIGSDQLAWTVMDGNMKAEAFYRSLGGKPDTKWNNWTLDLF